jgi:glycolate oxidase subunit GlcD
VTAGLWADLRGLLGEDALRDPVASPQYLHDATDWQGLRGRADAVVAPASTEEVARLVEWCYARQVAIVPRGGGTGLSGGAVPIDGGLVCSLERLNQVLSFEPELWRLNLQAGVTTDRVHQLARNSGLMFPPDPGAAAQSHIGGNIACNAGGPRGFKYGATRGYVTGLTAVIGGGRIITVGGPTRKDVAGYDICSLMVGSEGTLGVMTEAWLRLIPAPQCTVHVVGCYADVAAGVEAVLRVPGSGLVPATLEYFEGLCVEASRGAFPLSLPPHTRFLVVAEVDGSTAGAAALSTEVVEALEPGAIFAERVEGPGLASSLTRWRSGVSGAVSSIRGGKVSEDIAVPLDRLGEAILMTRAVGVEFGLPSCSWGHAGDGNLHATFMMDKEDRVDVARAGEAAQELFARALALGGSVSGEHGLGWIKQDQFQRQFGPGEVAIMTAIKAVFDPDGLFNPGKKLPDRRGADQSMAAPSPTVVADPARGIGQ